MNEPALKQRMTREEYLAFERASETKHELADGEVYAMSGGTRAHSRLQANLQRELGNQLEGGPCEVYTSDMRVAVTASGRYVYPDASIACADPRFEDAELDTLVNPKVVVEVLSDSTERYDRGAKFEHYRKLSSMTDYVLVSQHDVRVEHFRRQPDQSWVLRVLGPGDKLLLDSVGASVDIERLYLKVTLTPEPPPPPLERS